MHPRLRAQILLSRRFIGRGAEYLIALGRLTAALRREDEEVRIDGKASADTGSQILN